MIRSRPRAPLAALALSLAIAAACTRALAPPGSGAAKTVPAPAIAVHAGVDPATLERKLMFGYQGWFGCPGDGSSLGWEHWFRRGEPPGASTLRVDTWPDVSELDPDERCATPLRRADGRPAEVYSAHNPKTVARHFRWMRDYDLPGVFLQRFAARLETASVRAFRDAVLRNVAAAAESHQRVFAVMYDISGQPRETLVEAVTRDWTHLVDSLEVTGSPRYLHHRGRPVLALWGFGFHDRPATPGQAAELIEFFKNHPDPRYRVTLVGGVPSRWRTLTRDALPDPAWAAVYRAFDVISPWSVGRFRDAAGIDRFYAEEVALDLIETRRLGIDYMPVLFPGFSWHNMNPSAPLNAIPRLGGRFYRHQVARALDAGSTMLYGAMFDELDEGTAVFKLAATRQEAPADVPIVTLDADGDLLPSDWYLQLAREAQARLARGAPRDLPRAALPTPPAEFHNRSAEVACPASRMTAAPSGAHCR